MDPLTHTLVGIGMGNAFFRRSVGKAAVPIMAIASNLPDVDAIVHFTGDPTAILMRRTFGHSLFMLPFWALGLTLILKRFYPNLSYRQLLGMSFLGAAVHVFFDLVNSFGVVLLWPLTDWRPELGIVFIIDLILTGFLILPLVLSFPRSMRPYIVPLSRIAMSLVALYIVFCGANRMMAQNALAAEAQKAGLTSNFSYSFPEPFGPHRWRGVIKEGDTYRLFLIHPMSGRIESRGKVRTHKADLPVAQARQTRLASRLEWFFKAPVWRVVTDPLKDPADVTIHDLRFSSLVVKRGLPFVYRFRVNGNGRTEGVRWNGQDEILTILE